MATRKASKKSSGKKSSRSGSKKSSSKRSSSKKASAKKSSSRKSASKKSSARKYSKGAGTQVERELHEMHEGKLMSGRSSKKVTSRKQAIAIGLSEARRAGKKVPKKKAA